MGHTSEFLFSIYWWTWKTIIYQKKLLKWANKKLRILFYFKKTKKKNLEIPLFYTCAAKISIWWYRVWQTEIGNLVIFCPFTSLKTPKNQNFEKFQKLMEILFYIRVPKTTIIWGKVPEIQSQRHFLSFQVIFCPFTPYGKSKLWRNENSILRCHHFTDVYRKSRSYDVCFLRYQVWKT